MVPVYLDADKAVEKAKEFLDEYHDTIDLKSAELVKDMWMLIFDVGFLGEQLKQVKVDALTGRILGYTDAN